MLEKKDEKRYMYVMVRANAKGGAASEEG